jgi:drug/metabolite transporter (DMT)-like permease
MSALFLGKRFSRRELGALALAYGGIVLVFIHDVSLEGDGVALGSSLVFGSAVCYAAYLVISGELVRRVGAIRLTSYAMCVSTLAVFAQFVVLNPLSALNQPSPVYGLSLINGILCTVLPVFATMLAVERIGAGSTAVAAMVGPVSTIALAYFFLGERVGAWQLAGTTLVLVGIYVLSRSARPAPARAVNKENA